MAQERVDYILVAIQRSSLRITIRIRDFKVILNYLRQVNEGNGGDNVFVRCVCVCLSVCVCAAAGQWELNANSSKTVKAADFKFNIRVPRDSSHMTPKNFPKRGRL